MNHNFSFEDYLNKYETLTFTCVGNSMRPLLRQGTDLFTVRKKGPGRCRVGDVALYRRPPDQYVLHRIIEVRPDDYVILGDNCIGKEYGIRDEDIIGVMTEYLRNGRQHSTKDAGYRIYSFLILHTIGVRTFVKRWKAKFF
jgi:hypothetical protein